MTHEPIQIDKAQAIACDVSLSDVSYSVEGHEILKDISFSTDAARVGVVGRNGSGKSTLARVMAGLVAATSGEVRINGKDLFKDRKAALDEVGILFQNPEHQLIFPTVIEEITFGLRQLGQSKDRADTAARDTLQRFDKAHWPDAHVSTLSQGQKHLVCLMSVVAMKPHMLILDEPFSGLDIPTRKQLKRYLSHYTGSLMHITHDPADLQDYQHLIWLDQGSVALEGTAQDVLPVYIEQMNRLGGMDDISDLSV